MKRIIDLLTLLTLGLSILATSWSIDSFGQVTARQMEPLSIIEMDKYAADYLKMQRLVATQDLDATQLFETEPSDVVHCETFEFLGNDYFRYPEDHYKDSCSVNQKAPEGYFLFMGDFYPELPQEDVKLNFTY